MDSSGVEAPAVTPTAFLPASQAGSRGCEKADSPLRRRALLIAYHNDGSRSRESPSPSPGTPAPHGKDIPVDSLSAASSQCITRLPAPCYEPSTKALNLIAEPSGSSRSSPFAGKRFQRCLSSHMATHNTRIIHYVSTHRVFPAIFDPAT